MPSPKQILTHNGPSRSFKVIYFSITEEPLRGYIAQYNKRGLKFEGSEDIMMCSRVQSIIIAGMAVTSFAVLLILRKLLIELIIGYYSVSL